MDVDGCWEGECGVVVAAEEVEGGLGDEVFGGVEGDGGGGGAGVGYCAV